MGVAAAAEGAETQGAAATAATRTGSGAGAVERREAAWEGANGAVFAMDVPEVLRAGATRATVRAACVLEDSGHRCGVMPLFTSRAGFSCGSAASSSDETTTGVRRGRPRALGTQLRSGL